MRLLPLTAAFVVCATSAMSAVIEFEGQVPDGDTSVFPSLPYEEGGYQLTDASAGYGIFSPEPGTNTNGSDVFGFQVDSSFMLSAIDGGAFDLLNFQSTNISTSSSSAGELALTGELTGGGTITETFAHTLNNLETFSPDGFTDLASVTFFTSGSDSGAVIDNINVQAAAPVPIPAALPLLLSGLGGLALMRRRRASRG